MQSDLKALEFDGIRRLLDKLTRTPYGADAARGLEPAPDMASAQRFQDAVSVARTVIDAGAEPTLPDLPDIRAALRQSGNVGATLNASALHNLRLVMRAAERLIPVIEIHPKLCPEGTAVLRAPCPLSERLDATLATTGRLREDATVELGGLHQRRRQYTEEAGAVVRKRMQRPDLAAKLDNTDKVKWHNQRAVIVVHRDAAASVKGVRRGASLGGRDIMVEPLEAVGVNNQIETVVGQINAAEQKLLRELTTVVREHAEALHALLGALTWIDLALAAGHLSATFNGHAPRLRAGTGVVLRQAYHPLLLLQFTQRSGPQPIPLSIALDDAQRMLVVTGPNTGGKTVVLKTLGLLVTMAHCGLHVPAEEDCEFGTYRRVMVDVGDRQSLYHHLSTFAGHVAVLKRILEQADAETLVLLDELGTGTDPEEGAALAMSVMDELVARGVHGIVNTHLSALKGYAATKAHTRNASMLFDHEALCPTYHLQIGVPGESLGLLIAEKNGLPAELVQRAREHLRRITGRTA